MSPEAPLAHAFHYYRTMGLRHIVAVDELSMVLSLASYQPPPAIPFPAPCSRGAAVVSPISVTLLALLHSSLTRVQVLGMMTRKEMTHTRVTKMSKVRRLILHGLHAHPAPQDFDALVKKRQGAGYALDTLR